MAQDRLTMTFLFCRPYDIIIWAGQQRQGTCQQKCSMWNIFD